MEVKLLNDLRIHSCNKNIPNQYVLKLKNFIQNINGVWNPFVYLVLEIILLYKKIKQYEPDIGAQIYNYSLINMISHHNQLKLK
jgi:hypothetical protein